MSVALYKKLGIRSGMRLLLKHTPSDYLNLLGDYPKDIHILSRKSSNIDLIHLFCQQSSILEKDYFSMKECLKKDGMLWISWIKQSAGIPTDLNRETLRDFGLANGLVDVKVASVNEHWSALKFVYRVKDR